MAEAKNTRKPPVLYLVLPCYNEEEVLPVSVPLFLGELERMVCSGKIDRGEPDPFCG